MPNELILYCHFHKEFPFNYDNGWIKPTSARQRWSHQGVIDVTGPNPSIFEFREKFRGVSDEDFLAAWGDTATEYWLLHHTPDVPLIGCTSYRRYFLLNGAVTEIAPMVKLAPNLENCLALSSDSHRDAALSLLSSADAIVARPIALGQTIEAQYLQRQVREYWDLFLKAIELLFPHYRRHLIWFTNYSVINLYSPFIMRRELVRQYAAELFAVLEYVVNNASIAFPGKIEGARIQPYRYPAILRERFLPFFLYANGVRKAEVPLMFLND